MLKDEGVKQRLSPRLMHVRLLRYRYVNTGHPVHASCFYIVCCLTNGRQLAFLSGLVGTQPCTRSELQMDKLTLRILL